MKVDRTIAAWSFAAAIAAAAVAATAAPAPPIANPSPKGVQAGVYSLDTSHAMVQFAVSHMGLSTWYGDFSGTKASLNLNPANPAASSVEVTLPVGSVRTINATLTKELAGADWLDAGKFPNATFKSTKITLRGPNRADIAGDLTLHGVTRPVTLNAVFLAQGTNPLNKKYTVGFEATGKFKRSDFGVKTYLPMIGDEITLTISAPFEKN
jgi:polyisoprenoid-binding protein YceI